MVRGPRLVFILDVNGHSDWLVGQPHIVRFMWTRDSTNDTRAYVIRGVARGPLLRGLRSFLCPWSRGNTYRFIPILYTGKMRSSRLYRRYQYAVTKGCFLLSSLTSIASSCLFSYRIGEMIRAGFDTLDGVLVDRVLRAAIGVGTGWLPVCKQIENEK